MVMSSPKGSLADGNGIFLGDDMKTRTSWRYITLSVGVGRIRCAAKGRVITLRKSVVGMESGVFGV